MPVNYHQIQQQIREMGQKAPARLKELQDKRQICRQLLSNFANNLVEINERVDAASAVVQNLRCARPVNEALTGHFSAAESEADYVLLAADGSQINPSRHDAIEFGVINLGAIRFHKGEVPKETVKSELLYDEALYTPKGRIGEEILALRRDLRERTMLKDLAQTEKNSVITLTDGPLELFRAPKGEQEFEQGLQRYVEVLKDLAGMGVVTAGYVDKPRSDLVVRLMELMHLPADRLEQADQQRPFMGVTDQDLFEPLLLPGERSAIFSIESSAKQQFQGPLELHFFYLNVGWAEHTHISRVELPKWVALDAELLNLLQWILIVQCRQIGANPYPYALHRAHEVAVVKFEEKQQLENMIAVELHNRGINPGKKSTKQANKDLESRTRY